MIAKFADNIFINILLNGSYALIIIQVFLHPN